MFGELNRPFKLSRLLAGLATTAFCGVGVAASVTWSLPLANAPRDHTATSKPSPANNPSAKDARQMSSRGGIARQKVKCAGCGVIESIRKIEVDEWTAGQCTIDEIDRTRLPGSLWAGGHHKEVVTLADTVAGAIGFDENGKKIRRTTGYQIVVRFRDGSKHVFTEKTPRSLRLGDRVLVVGPNRLEG